jgi:DHHC palmitoyltransferase
MPPPRNENPRRKNGFSTPYTGAQLSTWVALPTLIVEFLVVVAPLLPLAASIPCTVVFGLTASLAAYYAYLAQKIDPLDDYLAKHLEKQKNGEDEPVTANNGFGGALGNVGDEVEPLNYCWICETQVAEHAMHCKFCNKCVGNFDHHCLCE